MWLVVIDNQVYIRLGSRAAGRMEANTTKPIVKVKIAGQTFDRVKAESVPDMAEAVAKAMGDKYTSDIFVRYFNHPLTMRLTPAPSADAWGRGLGPPATACGYVRSMATPP